MFSAVNITFEHLVSIVHNVQLFVCFQDNWEVHRSKNNDHAMFCPVSDDANFSLCLLK